MARAGLEKSSGVHDLFEERTELDRRSCLHRQGAFPRGLLVCGFHPRREGSLWSHSRTRLRGTSCRGGKGVRCLYRQGHGRALQPAPGGDQDGVVGALPRAPDALHVAGARLAQRRRGRVCHGSERGSGHPEPGGDCSGSDARGGGGPGRQTAEGWHHRRRHPRSRRFRTSPSPWPRRRDRSVGLLCPRWSARVPDLHGSPRRQRQRGAQPRAD
mmetsp:Transcript_24020/g.52040  ORF Transcript_24020/g.52040 Transcript_24020/m.52040 type:complete len:214 (+) Transcript_24020:211-852(+)